uniref:Uncharacterized protein n=1 Tax=Anguilla anguilla TaxID=7936 RepID=A0A0E9UHN9_ANGAN
MGCLLLTHGHYRLCLPDVLQMCVPHVWMELGKPL